MYLSNSCNPEEIPVQNNETKALLDLRGEGVGLYFVLPASHTKTSFIL